MTICPSVSYQGWACSREDNYDQHMSLTHRCEEEQMEWRLDNSDKIRWNLVQVKSRGKVINVEEVASDADVTTEDPTQLEGDN